MDRTLFWTAADLEMKLVRFQGYYKGQRAHAGWGVRRNRARLRAAHGRVGLLLTIRAALEAAQQPICVTGADRPTQAREEGVVLTLSASATDDDSSAARWLGLSAQASVAALFAVMIVSAAAYVKLSYASDRLPYPLDYGEGVVLYQASRLASFSGIYPADVNTPPYFSTNYPPLFAAMQAPLVNLFGPAYWYGRLISQIGLVIVALCLGATVWLLTEKRVAGIATTLLVPAVPVFAVWSQYNRVDSMALALTWVALVLLVRSRARWRIPLVALLLAASAFTRQSYALAGPVTALAVMLSGNDTRRARSFAMWFVGLGTVSALALEWATRGGFLRHVIIANVGTIAVHNLWDQYRDLGVTIPVLLGCAAAVMFGRLLPPRGRALARAYLLCGAFTSLLIVKVGSDVNYVYELAAGCVLAAGLIVAHALRRPITTVVAALVLAGQVATLAATRPVRADRITSSACGRQPPTPRSRSQDRWTDPRRRGDGIPGDRRQGNHIRAVRDDAACAPAPVE